MSTATLDQQHSQAIWSAPTLATLSPVGAPLAHTGLHVSAVVRAYDTDAFLPPDEKPQH